MGHCFYGPITYSINLGKILCIYDKKILTAKELEYQQEYFMKFYKG
jgi:hypothetical protein